MGEYFIYNGELYHYGVKGMKWGVRRARPSQNVTAGSVAKKKADLDKAKAERKVARKEYNKAFNKAYNRASAAYSPFKKHREANDKRWNDAANKAQALNAANKKVKGEKKAYKALKKMEKQQYKDAIKNLRKEINAGESVVGRLYNKLTDADKYQAEIMYAERNRNKR